VSFVRPRAWLFPVAGALAFAACSKGTLTPDGGAGAGAGGAGTIGTGQAGAGEGGAGEGAAAGTGEAGSGGAPGCTPASEHTICTPDAGAPPAAPFEGSPCTIEGARCEGFACRDPSSGSAWVSTCCAGRWRPSYVGTCPVPPATGEPFACGTSVGCPVGQSYCSLSNEDRTRESFASCEPLCAAGDCTCFCDGAEGCTFRPPGSSCAGDTCRCSTITGASGLPVVGAIQVECRYVVPTAPSCYVDGRLSGECPPGQRAMSCTGPPALGTLCTPLPDAVVTGSCGTEVRYYCCPN
jgi:hypothetical protein